MSLDQFIVIWGGHLLGDSTEEAEQLLDGVMEHLLDCLDVIDPSIGYNRSTKAVDVEAIVEAADALDAVRKASGLIRSAVHAAGIATPGWPTVDEIEAGVAIRFEQGPKVEPVPA